MNLRKLEGESGIHSDGLTGLMREMLASKDAGATPLEAREFYYLYETSLIDLDPALAEEVYFPEKGGLVAALIGNKGRRSIAYLPRGVYAVETLKFHDLDGDHQQMLIALYEEGGIAA